MEPNDLAPAFIEAVNRGDLEALVGLYEETAVLELPDGSQARGRPAIRDFYRKLLETGPRFTLGTQQPALVVGDLALTSVSVGDGDATSEIARRQPDGSWLWIADRPSVLRTP